MYGLFAISSSHKTFVTQDAIDADASDINRSHDIKYIEIAVSISHVPDLILTIKP